MEDGNGRGVLEPEMMTGRQCGVCLGESYNGIRKDRKWNRRNKRTSNGHSGDILARIFWYSGGNLAISSAGSVMKIMAKTIY
jgi:hypothetical protein